jgi:hypothetical protein
MKSNQEWIKKVMDANDLVAAGPVRIVTNEFGSETYSFDLVQPVRRKATGDADKGSEDGENGDKAKPAAPLADAEEIEIKVEGPVDALFLPAIKVAQVPFTGHMANLAKVRDALRAWALTQGYETVDRPYEDWNNGIEKGFTEEGDFVVYWTTK